MLTILLMILAQHQIGAVIDAVDGHGHEPLSYGLQYRYRVSNLELNASARANEKIVWGKAHTYRLSIDWTFKDHLIVGLQGAAVDYQDYQGRETYSGYLGWRVNPHTSLKLTTPTNDNYKAMDAILEHHFKYLKLGFQVGRATFQGKAIWEYGVVTTTWLNF